LAYYSTYIQVLLDFEKFKNFPPKACTTLKLGSEKVLCNPSGSLPREGLEYSSTRNQYLWLKRKWLSWRRSSTRTGRNWTGCYIAPNFLCVSFATRRYSECGKGM
jgi:hypothetical protein